MLDLITRVSHLKRPSLLVRAARFGVDTYRRDIHLRRILKVETLPVRGSALIQLLDIEAEMHNSRRQKSADYRPSHHIDVLIAIMGEAQLLAKNVDAQDPR